MPSDNPSERSKKQKIKEYLRDDQKLARAVAGSTTKKRKSSEARAMAKGDPAALKRGVYNLILNRIPLTTRTALFKKICEEWDYCDNRRDILGITSIVYIITGLAVAKLIPVCGWVYIIKTNMLHELCDCPGDPPIQFRRGSMRFGL